MSRQESCECIIYIVFAPAWCKHVVADSNVKSSKIPKYRLQTIGDTKRAHGSTMNLEVVLTLKGKYVHLRHYSSNLVISTGERGVLFIRLASFVSLSFISTSSLSTGTLLNKAETSYDLNSSSDESSSLCTSLTKS